MRNAPAGAEGREERNVVLLGHDPAQDIAYLEQLGYDPLDRSKLPNLVEILDTASLYRAWKREANPRALGAVLYVFDVPAWHLHNAGNDARYTLQALLAICVREAGERGSREVVKRREEEKIEKIVEATGEATRRVLEEAEGWSEGEQGDGGAPGKIEEVPGLVRQVQGQGQGQVGTSLAYGNSGERGRGRGARGGWSDRGRGNERARGRGFQRGADWGRGGVNQRRGGLAPNVTPVLSNATLPIRGSSPRGRGKRGGSRGSSESSSAARAESSI